MRRFLRFAVHGCLLHHLVRLLWFYVSVGCVNDTTNAVSLTGLGAYHCLTT